MGTVGTQSFKFDCDALYIETHSLHQEGKYQWALIYIDTQGAVIRLPTPKLPSRPTSRHGSASSTNREAHAPVVPAQPSSTSNPRGGPSQLLGYCKIGAYVGGLCQSEFEEVGNAALSGKKRRRAADVVTAGAIDATRAGTNFVERTGSERGGKGIRDQPRGRHPMATSVFTQYPIQDLYDHSLRWR